MICENCKTEEATHDLAGTKSCEDCLRDYWSDEDIGFDTCLSDFLNYTCTPLKSK